MSKPSILVVDDPRLHPDLCTNEKVIVTKFRGDYPVGLWKCPDDFKPIVAAVGTIASSFPWTRIVLGINPAVAYMLEKKIIEQEVFDKAIILTTHSLSHGRRLFYERKGLVHFVERSKLNERIHKLVQ